MASYLGAAAAALGLFGRTTADSPRLLIACLERTSGDYERAVGILKAYACITIVCGAESDHVKQKAQIHWQLGPIVGYPDSNMFPPFDMIWTEITSQIPNPGEGYTRHLLYVTDYKDQATYKAYVRLFEGVYKNGSRAVRDILDRFIAEQPDVSTVAAYDIDSLPRSKIPGEWDAHKIAIRQAITPFLDDDFAIHHVLGFFVHLGVIICDIYEPSGPVPVDVIVLKLSRYCAAHIFDPFGQTPVRVRKQLAKVDYVGFIWSIMYEIRQCMADHPLGELGWRINKCIIQCATDARNTDAQWHRIIRAVKYLHGEKKSWPTVTKPVLKFQPEVSFLSEHQFELYTALSRRSAFRNLSYREMLTTNADFVQDVQFDPVGPRLFATHCAVPTMTPQGADCCICLEQLNVVGDGGDGQTMQVPCGHRYHAKCLEQLINGISKFSNLCPTCRAKMGEPRPKRRRMVSGLVKSGIIFEPEAWY